MMNPIIHKIPIKSLLGEGPHWDAKTQTLYFVDIIGQTIHKYVPFTNQHNKAYIGKHISFILPVEEANDQFILSMGREINLIKWDGVSNSVSVIQKIAEDDDEYPNSMFNDGKASPRGNIWAGTIGKVNEAFQAETYGSLCSIDKNKKLKKHLSDINLSNGLAWSTIDKKFYYVDTGAGTIDQFDYDADTESISNRRRLFTTAKHNIDGFLDGATIDVEGNLWVAVFNSYKVIKVSTKIPETLLHEIILPGRQITSLTFGGANLDELYVTTGKLTNIKIFGDHELLEEDNGILYRVTNVGVKGFDGERVKLQ